MCYRVLLNMSEIFLNTNVKLNIYNNQLNMQCVIISVKCSVNLLKTYLKMQFIHEMIEYTYDEHVLNF